MATTVDKTTSHSLRVKDSIWARAQRRARGEDVKMNHVLTELLDGYARGLIKLPKVTKQYEAPAVTAIPSPSK